MSTYSSYMDETNEWGPQSSETGWVIESPWSEVTDYSGEYDDEDCYDEDRYDEEAEDGVDWSNGQDWTDAYWTGDVSGAFDGSFDDDASEEYWSESESEEESLGDDVDDVKHANHSFSASNASPSSPTTWTTLYKTISSVLHFG